MKYFFILLATVGMMFSVDQLLTETKTNIENQKEIDELIELVEEQDLQLSNLQTTIKEEMEIADIESFISEINGYQLDIQEKDQDKNRLKFSSDRQENNGITESILLVRTNEQEEQYQVIYTITATETAPEVLKVYKEKIKTITNGLFTKNAQYFSCVEAWKDGIIDIVCFINFVKTRLNMTITDEIKEPDFYTWTGYTPKWNNKLQLNDEEINLQIAVRERIGDRTTITIGTPILIHEY
ncbi:YwmB family TATA-box binding protein [Gracilibacillus lacisalsi]|uniref:YwmB family TATA-box binding protein n=1 Tax=Gracilibacillus lacisalsi TaxID=393087 RepID=UPI00036A3BCC|nr:YwmB family TATA-box binding protein [Gracilibacillus lacisalsi]